ncbi:velvet factor [Fusarium avenaceum]|nr:velvet factor [Fusarium avenaceum]
MCPLISTAFVGEDKHGEEGYFLCFLDLSCRTRGSLRPKFSLTKIDLAHAREVRHFPELATDNSDIFIINTAKDIPGMQASIELVKYLKEQGYIIPIKKGD